MTINKVILIGRLGNNPETKELSNGTVLASISIATSEFYKNKESQKEERTEWHRVKFFGRLAEIASEYLTKGSQVYIEGRIQTSKWQDNEGNERRSTEIIANQMQMLGNKNGGRQEKVRHQQIDSNISFDSDVPF